MKLMLLLFKVILRWVREISLFVVVVVVVDC